MIYTHILKGFTVGQSLTRRLFRTIFGLPGLIIDLLIGIFYPKPYSRFLKEDILDSKNEEYKIPYLDGTNVSICQGITGYFADLLGCVVGAIVGIVVGLALFFPNLLLLTVNWLVTNGIEQVSSLADYLKNCDWVKDHFVIFDFDNEFYFGKAWTLGTVFFGTALAAIPFILCKIIEFFIPPLQNYLSSFVSHIAGLIGAFLGCLIAIPTWPVIYLAKKLCELHDAFNDTVLKAIAFVYAGTDQEPETVYDEKHKNSKKNGNCCCLNDETLHSKEFRSYVVQYKTSFFEPAPMDAGASGASVASTPVSKIT